MTEAESLVEMGYRGYSNKYRILSRIDRDDWKEVLAASHVRGMDWVDGLGLWYAAELYRGRLSKDRIEDVDLKIYREVKQLVKERGLEEWRKYGYGW